VSGHPAVDGRFAPAGTYLDTASYGLPPEAAIEASHRALAGWRSGTASWPADWDPAGEACRGLLASIVGTDVHDVALIPAVSVGVAIVASILMPGDEVLVADDEFASLLLPLVAAEVERGVRIRRVPFASLVDELRPETALVAVSHVRSNGGAMIDLDALAAAARTTATPVLLDATHSAGVLTIDAARRGLDFVVAAGYKHLLCPRGVALLTVAERWHDQVLPRCASWRAQANPYGDYFGGDLGKLAPGAARFDVSLAWFSWIGAQASLALLDELPTAEREAWCVGLADALAARLGLEPTGSSVLGIPVRGERAAVADALARAGVRVTCGDGSVRASFHLYNDHADVERGAAALEPLLDTPGRP
jgi:selenocysteine lyase/cysteine desulfurase